MGIKYDKIFVLFKEKGLSSYNIRKDKILSEKTLQKLRTGGNIDTRTIVNLCKLLNCQPGDFMEYVPDDVTYLQQQE